MNSKEGFKGLLTFIILLIIVSISVVGIQIVINSANVESSANSSASLFDPTNIKTKPSQESVKITFLTTENIPTQIEYSETSDFEISLFYSESTQATQHEIELTQLKPSTTYYFRLKYKDATYPQDTYLRFDTEGIPTEVVEPITTTTSENSIIQTEEPSQNGNSILQNQILKSLLKPKTNTNPNSIEEEYSGFDDNTLEYNPSNQTLGVKTNSYGEVIAKIFKEAVLYKDLRYDFNGDKEVDAIDYPLFIKYITEQ